MAAKKHDSMTREQLTAMRDIKFASHADPVAEARRHEASFLGNMAKAKVDFDWIVANEAWVRLGHETFADWWDVRVAPVAAGLGMRPTREIAKVVIEKVVEDQKDLPKAQQRTQRQIAAMVGTNQSTVARSTADANASGADLEGGAEEPTDEESDPVVPVASPSAQSDGSGMASGSAPAEQEEPASSPPADERPQGDAGVSSPAAAPQPVETDEAKAERERLEFRTDRTVEFADALVNLTMRLGKDPIAWYEQVYLHGAYPDRHLPQVADCFEPKSLHRLATFLDALGEHLTQTGKTL